MAELCTIQDIHIYKQTEYNPSEPSSLDELYGMLIPAVSEKIENLCNRTFDITSYTEIQDGEGTNVLVLSQFPIVSLTSVNLLDATGDISEVLDLDYIRIDYANGYLHYTAGTFYEGDFNYSVVYSAGYSEIPDDLMLICVQAVVNTVDQSEKNGNLTSEKLGDYTWVSKTVINLSAELLTKLESYRKYD